ncbi:HNH endonuclease [Picosynechococcus sp. NKBG15041c]|uniref:HNH endonuclease n=1 Tax=Picosynechococcus sp. NKBG15041c TaxID=1407650 RepID=UPI000465AA3B|nr:HNH endonuclease signature motif containing protein [Picosynechococcus sp. NKBG15041c]
MGRSPLPEKIQNKVRERAKGLCEYCHGVELWQYVRFTVDHVIPRARGGSDDVENLALACFHCNRKKSSFVTGVDLLSGAEVRLFNPRCDRWADHFVWAEDGVMVVGLTEIGRATIARLDMNRERVLLIRQADRDVGRHPPKLDRLLGDSGTSDLV